MSTRVIENSKQFLLDNPEMCHEIEVAIRQSAGLADAMDVVPTPEEKAANAITEDQLEAMDAVDTARAAEPVAAKSSKSRKAS